MKIIIIIIIILIIPIITTSQQVISSGGQSSTSSTLQGSATIGEAIIGSASTEIIGNQGFQQPLLKDITAVIDINEQQLNVIISPNPVLRDFSIRFDKQPTQTLHAKITSINGQVIKHFQIDQGSSHFTVQLDAAMEGLFILTLSHKNGKSIHHFKILKIKS